MKTCTVTPKSSLKTRDYVHMALSEEPKVYIMLHSFNRKFQFICTGKKAGLSLNSGMTVDFSEEKVISVYVIALIHP